MLADKLEAFDNNRRSLPSGPRRYVKASEIVNDGRQVSFRKPERPPKREYSHQVPNERSPLRCCGKQGVIKSRCPTCNLNASQRADVATKHINAYTARTRSLRLTLIDITFCGIKGRVCSDTGSSCSIAGERMFQIFKDKGLLFQETTLVMSFVDGQQTNSAGLVLDLKNACWYFWDNPTHKYPFGEELDTPSIVEKMSSNTCQLREGEGESLTSVCVCAQKASEASPSKMSSNQGEKQQISWSTTLTREIVLLSQYPHTECLLFKSEAFRGLLQTPVPAQRFVTLAIDLFGPLPESKDGKRWILIIEDCTTKWVKLFALPNDTAKECAITLIKEVLLRYGIPRRLISDNGTQFVSAVMQQICYLLNIHQSLIPVYHLQANPVERKNRDQKPRLAILVQDKHDCWSEKLPFILFALNTAKCETTGQTAAFLNFGRELRSPSEVVNDMRVIIQNDNFVPEITPYLKKFAKFSTQIREVVVEQQDSRKFYADKKRKTAPTYQPGEHVFVASHPLSNAAQGRSAKLMPCRDDPLSSSYEIASLDNPGEPLGVYHTSALTPFNNDKVKPLIPLRKRGHLRSHRLSWFLVGTPSKPEGEDVTNAENELCDELQQSEVSSSKPNIINNQIFGAILLEALEGFLFIVNNDGKVGFISENVSTYLKFTQDEVFEKNIYNFIHPDDRARFNSNLLLMMPLGNGRDWSTDSTYKSGKPTKHFNCRFLVKQEEPEIKMENKQPQEPQYESLNITANYITFEDSGNEETRNGLSCIARRATFEDKRIGSNKVEQFTTRVTRDGKVIDIDTE
ncbi:nuclear receptor coactivator 2 [Trichonephila clavipes]|nr:nuclear receptor coactivator 2 [Trichonephila clavipes]